MARVIAERSADVASYLIAEETGVSFELRKNLFLLGSIQRILFENQQDELALRYEEHYQRLIEALQLSGRG